MRGVIASCAMGAAMLALVVVQQAKATDGEPLADTAGVVVGLGDTLPAYRPAASVAGHVRCVGGDTMHDLWAQWATGFRQYHPRATVEVDRHDKLSADGIAALLEGRADCVLMVRELFVAETAAFRARFGVVPQPINVAGGSYATKGGTHAIAVYVNIANPVSKITLTELDAIFSTTRLRGAVKPIQRWDELDGQTGNKLDEIHRYGMLRRRETGNPPGIVNFLEQRVLAGGSFRDDLIEQRDKPGETALEAIVNRVAEDVAGIGFAGFACCSTDGVAATTKARIKTLRVAETSTSAYLAGTLAEVGRRSYPLSRQIYVLPMPWKANVANPLLMELLRFAASREGQAIVEADRVKFLPLTPSQALQSNRQLDTWQQLRVAKER